MKVTLLIMLAIGISGLLTPHAFGITEELIHGSSSIELLPSEINLGKPTSFEIKFQYTEGPYALDNFIPIIEVSPASAKPYVTIDVKPTGVTNRQILRIPVTLTVDSQIEHEKIFLSVSFSGDHFSSRSDAIYKSAWSESVILNISSREFTSSELPSSQDYEFCKDPNCTIQYVNGTTKTLSCNDDFSDFEDIGMKVFDDCELENENLPLISYDDFSKVLHYNRCTTDSICFGTFANETQVKIQCEDRVYHGCGPTSFNDYDVFYQAPLKQYNSGVAIDEIQCKTGLEHTIKINDFKRFYCTSPDTKQILIKRGWAFDESKACRNPIDCFDSRVTLDKTDYPESEPVFNEDGTVSENKNPYTFYDISGIKQIYRVGEQISFTEIVQGFDNPCVSPHYEILDGNTLEPVWEHKVVYPCPFIKEPQQFKIINKIPDENISSPILNQTGPYILRSYHTYSDGFSVKTFSVVDD